MPARVGDAACCCHDRGGILSSELVSKRYVQGLSRLCARNETCGWPPLGGCHWRDKAGVRQAQPAAVVARAPAAPGAAAWRPWPDGRCRLGAPGTAAWRLVPRRRPNDRVQARAAQPSRARHADTPRSQAGTARSQSNKTIRACPARPLRPRRAAMPPVSVAPGAGRHCGGSLAAARCRVRCSRCAAGACRWPVGSASSL